MKRRYHKISLFLLLTLLVAACTNGASQAIKTTQASTKQAQVTASLTHQMPTSSQTVTPYYQDVGYYEGIIAITQYYTFLGHGLYEEAYRLLSSSAQQHSPALEDYIQDGKRWFRKVQIITIQPLYVEIGKQGGDSYHPPDTKDKKRYYVQIIAWGEGRMTGAAVSGDLQTLFITLVRENGEWRIDSTNTAP